MANVLNRQSKLLLTSVNTPDYTVEDWVINPDLSAVEGVPTKYWIIDTQVTEEQQMIGVEEDEITPIYETVTLSVDTVRPMTAEEIGVYDVANPTPPVFTGKLDDGTPAYFDVGEQKALAINKTLVTFALDTKGARNCYLDYQGQNGAESGFVLAHNAVLKEVSVSFKKAVSSQVTIMFRDTTTKENLAGVVVASGTKVVTLPLTLTDLAPASISCYLESASKVVSPIVTATIVQCN